MVGYGKSDNMKKQNHSEEKMIGALNRFKKLFRRKLNYVRDDYCIAQWIGFISVWNEVYERKLTAGSR